MKNSFDKHKIRQQFPYFWKISSKDIEQENCVIIFNAEKKES